MKKFFLVLVLTLFSTNSFAVQVKSARLDGAKKNILVEVVHGGGCGDHEYKLKLGACLESIPVQCSAEIIHRTNDRCEAIIARTAVFNIKEYRLDDRYFRGGSLTISGEGSTVTVRLP